VDKDTFKIDGSANDLCPGDGLGARLQFGIRFMDGSGGETKWWKAEGNCADPSTPVQESISRDRNIRYVFARMCTTDPNGQATGAPTCGFDPNDLDNPSTP
jgi:hypothetical protein